MAARVLGQRYQWLGAIRQALGCAGGERRNRKGLPLRTALPELIDLEGPGGVLLAEITPAQHMKTQTFLKSQNLIRHWITSFAFVEHGVSLRPFWGSVQSRKFVVAGSTMGEVSLASAHTKSAFLRA
ncbi:hypothetical protein C4375_08620 [Devosia sp. I507]|nr:hypothetical protein C4375_08620 [Devosia sp. I507]